MKILHMLAAAGLMATGIAVAPAPAEAQRYYGDSYRGDTWRNDRRWRDDRRGDWRRHHRWNRGRYWNRGHQRCWIERRRGGRVTVCRR